jgi:hypothetical protein
VSVEKVFVMTKRPEFCDIPELNRDEAGMYLAALFERIDINVD